MTRVSIITVCLNAIAGIERCILSALAQTHPDIEYLVIDGGSTDGTLEAIERYHQRIAYFISEPDRGLYDAMNKGIRAAAGDYIFFLNSDDYFCDDQVVADVARVIENDPSLDLVYGDVLMQSGDDLVRKPQVEDLNRESLCRRGFCHQALFARRGLLLRTDGFDEGYRIVADGDWLAKTLAFGAKCRHIRRDIATIALDGLSGTTNWREEKRRYLRSNYTPWELFLWRKLPGIFGRK